MNGLTEYFKGFQRSFSPLTEKLRSFSKDPNWIGVVVGFDYKAQLGLTLWSNESEFRGIPKSRELRTFNDICINTVQISIITYYHNCNMFAEAFVANLSESIY